MVSRDFLDNIASGDLMTVRSALLDDLIIDRTFKTFDEDFKAAAEKLNLLVPYDKVPFENDSEKWDKEYLNQQKVALMVNFSEERITHLKAVISKIMPPDLSKSDNDITANRSSSDSRTGRTIQRESPTVRKTEQNKVGPQTAPRSAQTKTGPAPCSASESGRTGRRVIRETPAGTNDCDKKKQKNDKAGTAVILGAAAATAVGFACSEPVVIGAGFAVMAAGAYIKFRR